MFISVTQHAILFVVGCLTQIAYINFFVVYLNFYIFLVTVGSNIKYFVIRNNNTFSYKLFYNF